MLVSSCLNIPHFSPNLVHILKEVISLKSLILFLAETLKMYWICLIILIIVIVFILIALEATTV